MVDEEYFLLPVAKEKGLLNELTDRARHEYISPYDLAIAFTGIGDHACALDHLEQAFSERVMRIVMLGDPEFDGLRAEPRYRRLLDGLRLPNAPMGEMSHIFASWNQINGWLMQVEGLRRVGGTRGEWGDKVRFLRRAWRHAADPRQRPSSDCDAAAALVRLTASGLSAAPV